MRTLFLIQINTFINLKYNIIEITRKGVCVCEIAGIEEWE